MNTQRKTKLESLYIQKLESIPLKNIQSNVIETSFGTTHFLSCGNPLNPTIILLHGTNSCAPLFLEYFAEFESDFNIVAIDLPGELGKSVNNRLNKSKNEYGYWLKECIESINIVKPIVIGYSLGAFVALNYVSLFSKTIKKMILVSPAGIIDGSFQSGIKGLKELFSFKITKKDYYLEQMYLSLSDAVDILNVQFFKEAIKNTKLDFSRTPLLKTKIDVETIIISGTKDVVFDNQILYKKSKQLFSNLSFENVKDEKHLISINVLNTLIKEYLFD